MVKPISIPAAYLDYPFKPVVAIPSVNCFWVRKYKIRIGMTVMTAPAISRCVCGPASFTKVHRPTIKGRQVAVVVTSKGHKKAFQEPMKAKIKTVRIGALLIGKTTWIKKRR